MSSSSFDDAPLAGQNGVGGTENVGPTRLPTIFHGRLNRIVTERRLTGEGQVFPAGSYILRRTENEANKFVLSVVNSLGDVHHFEIAVELDSFSIGGERINSLADIIHAYTYNFDILAGLRLDRFLPTPSPSLEDEWLVETLCNSTQARRSGYGIGSIEFERGDLFIVHRVGYSDIPVVNSLRRRTGSGELGVLHLGASRTSTRSSIDDLSGGREDTEDSREAMFVSHVRTGRAAVLPSRLLRPYNSVADVESAPGFHGNISKSDAIRLLSKARKGQYLLRRCDPWPGDYVLMVLSRHGPKKFRLERDGRWLLFGNRTFTSVDQIIRRYRDTEDLAVGCRLNEPILDLSLLRLSVSPSGENLVGNGSGGNSALPTVTTVVSTHLDMLKAVPGTPLTDAAAVWKLIVQHATSYNKWRSCFCDLNVATTTTISASSGASSRGHLVVYESRPTTAGQTPVLATIDLNTSLRLYPLHESIIGPQTTVASPPDNRSWQLVEFHSKLSSSFRVGSVNNSVPVTSANSSGSLDNLSGGGFELLRPVTIWYFMAPSKIQAQEWCCALSETLQSRNSFRLPHPSSSLQRRQIPQMAGESSASATALKIGVHVREIFCLRAVILSATNLSLLLSKSAMTAAAGSSGLGTGDNSAGSLSFYCVLCADQLPVARTHVSTYDFRSNMISWADEFQLEYIPPDVKEFRLVVFVRRKHSPSSQQPNAKDAEVGQVTVDLAGLWVAGPIDKWLPLAASTANAVTMSPVIGDSSTSSATDGASTSAAPPQAQLRAKLHFTQERILPCDEYHSLERLLVEDMSVPALRKLWELWRESAEGLARALVQIFAHSGRDVSLLMKLLYVEVQDCDETSILFRSNSMLTAVMEQFMRSATVEFLRYCLEPLIERIYKLDRYLELSQQSSPQMTSDQLKRNLATLEEILTFGVNRIFTSVEYCPRSLRYLCGYIKKCVKEKWPEDEQVQTRAVSGFIFLRLLCPALLNPHAFSLVNASPSETVSRNLKLVARCLQNLANLNYFGAKMQYMSDLNDFIRRHMDSLIYYVDQIGALTEPPERSEVPVHDVSRALARIHHVAVDTTDRLEKASTNLKELRTLLNIIAILTASLNNSEAVRQRFT